jgi:hypothetical protein
MTKNDVDAAIQTVIAKVEQKSSERMAAMNGISDSTRHRV